MKPVENTQVRTPAEQHAAMTWAQRLKRAFCIDIEVCGRCGGFYFAFDLGTRNVSNWHKLDLLAAGLAACK